MYIVFNIIEFRVHEILFKLNVQIMVQITSLSTNERPPSRLMSNLGEV